MNSHTVINLQDELIVSKQVQKKIMDQNMIWKFSLSLWHNERTDYIFHSQGFLLLTIAELKEWNFEKYPCT